MPPPLTEGPTENYLKMAQTSLIVIPAKARIKVFRRVLDPGLRRGDGSRGILGHPLALESNIEAVLPPLQQEQERILSFRPGDLIFAFLYRNHRLAIHFQNDVALPD